jgi:hypothetical protein
VSGAVITPTQGKRKIVGEEHQQRQGDLTKGWGDPVFQPRRGGMFVATGFNPWLKMYKDKARHRKVKIELRMIWRGQVNVERTIVFLSGGLFVGEEHQQRQGLSLS